MKQLANKPLLLAAVLTVPLWIVFGNFLVGLMVAIFAAFLIAMCRTLYILKRSKNSSQPREDRTKP